MSNDPARRLPSCPLSYPAGSSSWEPYRFRVVSSDPTPWVNQLINAFPVVSDFFGGQNLALNAYPATLGLTGFCPSVDTYLHAPTFFSGLQLAAHENCNVLVAAQPLIAADLLHRACCESFALPKRILCVIGGYFTPATLEKFIQCRLGERGVDVTILHSYGMAEVGHSLLCGMQRFRTGEPAFRQIPDQIQLKSDETSQLHIVNQLGQAFATGDIAERRGESWLIRSSSSRLDPRVKDELESWGDREWARRTGYLHASNAGFHFQLRENVKNPAADEICYHMFWHRFGGGVTMKPKWNWQTPE